MAQHTPGPWQATKLGADAAGKERGMAYRICAPTQGSEREYEIAVTYNKPYAEHTEANARLLAAGPAMYLALYKIAQWRALVEQNKDDALLTITREAMQALDQVEGRA